MYIYLLLYFYTFLFIVYCSVLALLYEGLLSDSKTCSEMQEWEPIMTIMALSLDSIYYQQNVDDQETREEEIHMQYFSGMPSYETYQTSPIH